eukprot:s405_g6.t2
MLGSKPNRMELLAGEHPKFWDAIFSYGASGQPRAQFENCGAPVAAVAMVLDPSLFHQPDNHWHEVPNTHAGYDSSAHHWPHDRALRHRVQDVPGHAALPAETLPRHRRRAEGPWFLGPSGHPENVLVKLKEPLEPDARPLEVALPPALANLAGQLGRPTAALRMLWSQAWDLPAQRKVAYAQLKDLAEVSTLALPSLAFGVGQALYSYFWFEDNGGKIDLEAADLSVRLHDLSLQHSGCSDLSMGVGTFLSKAGRPGGRRSPSHAFSCQLPAFGGLGLVISCPFRFADLKEYPFFSFRRWQVAQRSCKLLAERPEIARCHARDVGAAFARLQPGMGIKPHLWNAPPRLAVHLGLITPPGPQSPSGSSRKNVEIGQGATMAVGSEELRWEEGKATKNGEIRVVRFRRCEMSASYSPPQAVVFDAALLNQTPIEERPILSSAVETRTSRAGKGGKAVHRYPEVPPNVEGGAWGILGGQQPGGQEILPADCFPALPARSLRHAIAYSNIDGQEQVHETKVTCSGEDCETMSNDVMPQIIRVRTPTKAAKPRLCTGSPFQGPGLVWDGFDNLAHRVANSARRLFGYTPAAEDVRHDEVAMPPANHKSEGVMKSYVYFNNNGHEEMKQIESHCKDGTCVQRTRTFAPHSMQAVYHPVPQAATTDQHVHKVHAAAGHSPQARADIQHSTHQATGMPYEA